jgi:hypothetical protein
MGPKGTTMAESKAPAPDTGTFGTCCTELKDAIAGEEFEPLITVGEDGVLYISVGLVDLDEEEPAMVDHPLFFCPFCGAKVQTPDEVAAKAGHDEDDEEDETPKA